MLTLERLKEVLDCDPEAGTFTWKVDAGPQRIGAPAGTDKGKGYFRIQIDRELHYRHRLVWLYVHGEWPAELLDHHNGIPGDDRIENLRPASHSQSIANRGVRCDNKSGLKGVQKRGGRWVARITHNRKCTTLGPFDTAEEAHEAYKKVARELHGEFFRAA